MPAVTCYSDRRQNAADGEESLGRRPLVSLVVVSYNNASFLAEAVASAFEQDYSPLEIILSDDASSDESHTVLRRMAAQYRGPHTVRVNRNSRNLGVSVHLCRCATMAKGELIVGAAGDDVSVPWRVTSIVRRWVEAGMRPMSLFSNSTIIDENGEHRGLSFAREPSFARNLDDFKNRGRCWLTGCSHAFSRALVDEFAQIDGRILQEDGALAFRAVLRGGIEYIPDPLVLYRQHGGNTYDAKSPERMARLMRAEYFLARGWWNDAGALLEEDRKLRYVLVRAVVRTYVRRMLFSLPGVGTHLAALRLAIGRVRSRARNARLEEAAP